MSNDGESAMAVRQTDWSAWERWADGRVAMALEHERNFQREVMGGALGEIISKFDGRLAELRQEIREAPPLFTAPDKKLAAAMVRVGEELRAIREAIEASRAAAAEGVQRVDLSALRRQLGTQIAELEEHGESTVKNLHSVVGIVFSVSSALERVHSLVARLAVATGNAEVLTAGDENLLSVEEKETEEKNSASVIGFTDLRHARSA